MLVTTSIKNSLYRLPQSTAAVIVCRNGFKVANLKRLKLGIVHILLSSFFSNQLSA